MQESPRGSDSLLEDKERTSGSGIMPSMHGLFSRMTSGSTTLRDFHRSRSSTTHKKPAGDREERASSRAGAPTYSTLSSADLEPGQAGQSGLLPPQSFMHFSSITGACDP